VGDSVRAVVSVLESENVFSMDFSILEILTIKLCSEGNYFTHVSARGTIKYDVLK
jgi:hypothetical protein